MPLALPARPQEGSLGWGGLMAAILCIAHVTASTHREHKVHNIVLYPDKHSWCNATPIKQVVGQAGCTPVEVENNVCVGGCFSYSIPRTEPHAPGEVAPYCDSCQPSAVSWKHVTLECEGGAYEGERLSKRVQVILGCQCAACNKHESARGHGDRPAPADVPQLLALTSRNRTYHTTHRPLSPRTNHKLSILLKRLTEEEESKGGLNEESLEAILSDMKDADLESDDSEPPVSEEVDKNLLQQPEEQKEDVAVNIVKLRHILGPHHKHHHKTDEEHKPTVEVSSDDLRPAHVGAEISYHGDRSLLGGDST